MHRCRSGLANRPAAQSSLESDPGIVSTHECLADQAHPEPSPEHHLVVEALTDQGPPAVARNRPPDAAGGRWRFLNIRAGLWGPPGRPAHHTRAKKRTEDATRRRGSWHQHVLAGSRCPTGTNKPGSPAGLNRPDASGRFDRRLREVRYSLSCSVSSLLVAVGVSVAFLTLLSVLPRRSAFGPNRRLSWSVTESSRPCL